MVLRFVESLRDGDILTALLSHVFFKDDLPFSKPWPWEHGCCWGLLSSPDDLLPSAKSVEDRLPALGKLTGPLFDGILGGILEEDMYMEPYGSALTKNMPFICSRTSTKMSNHKTSIFELVFWHVLAAQVPSLLGATSPPPCCLVTA